MKWNVTAGLAHAQILATLFHEADGGAVSAGADFREHELMIRHQNPQKLGPGLRVVYEQAAFRGIFRGSRAVAQQLQNDVDAGAEWRQLPNPLLEIFLLDLDWSIEPETIAGQIEAAGAAGNRVAVVDGVEQFVVSQHIGCELGRDALHFLPERIQLLQDCVQACVIDALVVLQLPQRGLVSGQLLGAFGTQVVA